MITTPLPAPQLDLACTITVETDPTKIWSTTRSPWGNVLVVDVVGGTVEGPLLAGKLLPSGADWSLQLTDEQLDGPITNLDARLAIELDDGAIVTMRYRGLSYTRPGHTPAPVDPGAPEDPADFYVRTMVELRTGASAHDWLNRAVFLGVGTHRKQAGPIYTLYAVR